MNYFDKLIKLLKDKKYEISVENHSMYKFVRISGNNIIAGLCTPHDENHINSSYPHLNGKISADHEECFNKWSSCPLNLPLPQNDDELTYLMDQLNYWGSDEGLECSNNYEYEKWVEEYPPLKSLKESK